MELSKFENGIHKHHDKIRKTLNDKGIFIQQEFGYSYTIGMKYLGCPDIIIFGQRQDVAEEIIQVLIQAVKLEFINLCPGENLKKFLDPKPELVIFGESEKRRHFFSARTYYENWDFAAVNLVMTQQNEMN